MKRIISVLCLLAALPVLLSALPAAAETLFSTDDFEMLCWAQDENGDLLIGGMSKRPLGRLICVDATGRLRWSLVNELEDADWYSGIVPCGNGRYMALHNEGFSRQREWLEVIEDGRVIRSIRLPDEQAFSLYPAEGGVLLLTGGAIDATHLTKWSYDGEQLWRLDFGKGYRFEEVLTLEEGYLGIGYHIPNHDSAGDAAVCLIDKEGQWVQEYYPKKDSQWVDAAIHGGSLYLVGQTEHEQRFKGIVAANTSAEGMEPVIYTPYAQQSLTPFSLLPTDGGFLVAGFLWNRRLPTALTLTRFDAECRVVDNVTCPMEGMHAISDCRLFMQNGQAFALVCGTVKDTFQFTTRLVRLPVDEGAAR